MDKFTEQMVEKQRTAKDYAVIAVLYAVAVILAAVMIYCGMFLIPYVGVFAFLGAAGLIYGAWFVSGKKFQEFEYIVTNGEIDVDKIVARRKRSRLITIKCQTVEAGGAYSLQKHQNLQADTKIFACENLENAFYLVFRDAKKGKVLLVFSPNAAVISLIRPYLPFAVADAFPRIDS